MNSIGGGRSLLKDSKSFAGRYEVSSNLGEGRRGEASILSRKVARGMCLARPGAREQSRN